MNRIITGLVVCAVVLVSSLQRNAEASYYSLVNGGFNNSLNAGVGGDVSIDGWEFTEYSSLDHTHNIHGFNSTSTSLGGFTSYYSDTKDIYLAYDSPLTTGAHLWTNSTKTVATMTTQPLTQVGPLSDGSYYYDLTFDLIQEYLVNGETSSARITQSDDMNVTVKLLVDMDRDGKTDATTVLMDSASVYQLLDGNDWSTVSLFIDHDLFDYDSGYDYRFEFSFANRGGSAYLSMTNVNLKATHNPEPATWAMLVGMGFVGTAAYRRRSKRSQKK